jgi:hypothetical protein
MSVYFCISTDNNLLRCLTLKVTSMKNTILKKDEEIERLKSLSTSAGGISKSLSMSVGGISKSLSMSVGGISKQIQKLPSGSYKHPVESDIQQAMDDQKNELLRSYGTSRRETRGFSDTNSQERSSDFSDNNSIALGTETDGSSDNSITSEAKKSSKTTK